jgi:hypothetical protein
MFCNRASPLIGFRSEGNDTRLDTCRRGHLLYTRYPSSRLSNILRGLGNRFLEGVASASILLSFRCSVISHHLPGDTLVAAADVAWVTFRCATSPASSLQVNSQPYVNRLVHCNLWNTGKDNLCIECRVDSSGELLGRWRTVNCSLLVILAALGRVCRLTGVAELRCGGL